MDIDIVIKELRKVMNTLYWIESNTSNSIRLGVLEESNITILVSSDGTKYIFQRVVETEHNRFSFIYDLEYPIKSKEAELIQIFMQEIKELLASKNYISFRDKNNNLVLDNSNRFIKAYFR
jgi:uncharacterized protein YrzB (UPF0473 family)